MDHPAPMRTDTVCEPRDATTISPYSPSTLPWPMRGARWPRAYGPAPAGLFPKPETGLFPRRPKAAQAALVRDFLPGGGRGERGASSGSARSPANRPACAVPPGAGRRRSGRRPKTAPLAGFRRGAGKTGGFPSKRPKPRKPPRRSLPKAGETGLSAKAKRQSIAIWHTGNLAFLSASRLSIASMASLAHCSA